MDIITLALCKKLIAETITGQGISIKRTQPSIAEMTLDFNNPDIAQGDLVGISSSVEDNDNAKIYIKGINSFEFLMDLSGMPGPRGEQGPQGIQGPKGDTGLAAGFGEITATVDSTSGVPHVEVITSGEDTAKNFTFNFTGLKGTAGTDLPQISLEDIGKTIVVNEDGTGQKLVNKDTYIFV